MLLGKSSFWHNFLIRRPFSEPFVAPESGRRALSSRLDSNQFWALLFLTILRHLVLSSWLHLPNGKAFGPQKLTESMNWTVHHLRNKNILFQSAKRAYGCQNVLPYQLSRCPSMAPPLQKKSCLPNEKAFTKMKHFIISPLYNLGDQINFFQVNITLHAWLKTK